MSFIINAATITTIMVVVTKLNALVSSDNATVKVAATVAYLT